MRYFFIALVALFSVMASAQEANPVMTYTDTLGMSVEATEYDGSAPFAARFTSNVTDAEDYIVLYEWRFTRLGESAPYLVRYDADTELTFTQSGTHLIQLIVSFVQGGDTIEYVQETPFSVNIRESRLEFPNVITPNNDGRNDELKPKQGWQSIVSFHARVFSRSGRLIYEWTDPAGKWDGRSGGRVVPDGAYYLRVDAMGADGRKYEIRKTISVLSGYREESQ